MQHADEALGALPYLVGFFLNVVGRREEGNGYRIITGIGAVVHTLVVEVESEYGVIAITHAFEQDRLRTRQPQGIPVQVDIQRIPTLIYLGAIGINHRHEQKSQLARPFPAKVGKLVVVGRQKIEHIHQCHRGGRFIAMHLRPHKHRLRSVAPLHEINWPALDRDSLLLNGKIGVVMELINERVDVGLFEKPIGYGAVGKGFKGFIKAVRKRLRCGISGGHTGK